MDAYVRAPSLTSYVDLRNVKLAAAYGSCASDRQENYHSCPLEKTAADVLFASRTTRTAIAVRDGVAFRLPFLPSRSLAHHHPKPTAVMASPNSDSEAIEAEAAEAPEAAAVAYGSHARTRSGREATMATPGRHNDVDVRLVNAVKERPTLWDHKFAFDHKETRDQEWQEVAKELNTVAFPDGTYVAR